MAGSVRLMPSLDDIRAARRRIAGVAIRPPLVPLNLEDAAAGIFLSLELLQPVGSFKARGAGNAMTTASEAHLQHGVWTASAGNMAQAVGWHACRRGLARTVIIPDHAPSIKVDAIARLGAKTVKVPFAEWLENFRTRRFEACAGSSFIRSVTPR
jgi:threonine dehydratase